MTNLSTLEVPGPTGIALTAPFWDAVEEGRLLVQHCSACDGWVFYPREICALCWADALEWRHASGQGRWKSFSLVHRPGHPGWAPAAPYAVGLVRLSEGPTMMSHILCDNPRIGMPLRLAPTVVGGRILPCFVKSKEET